MLSVSEGKCVRLAQSTWKRSVGVAAMVAVLLVGTSGVAAAGSAPATAATTAAEPVQDSNLHGSFTVINLDRSVQPRQWQWGEVTALDAVRFTVRSADGFSGTYLIGPGVSVTGFAVGDIVTVVGAGRPS